MSKTNASKITGLSVRTGTRLPLPDARMTPNRITQDEIRRAFMRKNSGAPFQKVGIVGPQK